MSSQHTTPPLEAGEEGEHATALDTAEAMHTVDEEAGDLGGAAEDAAGAQVDEWFDEGDGEFADEFAEEEEFQSGEEEEEELVPGALGASSLHEAALRQDVDFLVANMLQPCTTYAYNSLPAVFAAARERDGLVVSACADLGLRRDVTLKTGESMVIFLLQDRHSGCKEGLIDYGPLKNGEEAAPLDLHHRLSTLEMLRLLALQGFLMMAPADVYEDQVSPLHWAARDGCVHCLRQLIIWGADIDARASDGCTALIHAAYFGMLDTVRILIEHGANIFATSGNVPWTIEHHNAQKTALDYAENTFVCSDLSCYCFIQRNILAPAAARKMECAAYLRGRMTSTRSLREIARHAVVRGIGSGNLHVAHNLPVPQAVKDMILFPSEALLGKKGTDN